jgi:carboxyl-terminal processing protease
MYIAKKIVLVLYLSTWLGLSSAASSGAKKEALPLEDLQRFTTVVENIRNYYVDSATDKALFDNAIRGMLSGLDPHSSYMDPTEFSDLKISTTGEFGGLGIEVTLEEGFIRVISPIDDTPAQKSGLQAGDLIIRLDDTPVKGLSLRKAVDLMRGKAGSPINLTIIRKGENKPLKIKVTREVIRVKSVRSKLLEPGYAYLRVSQFQSQTGDEVMSSVKKLMDEAPKKQLKGLILDLRNNPGGILEASVKVASTFLNRNDLKYDGLVVYTKGRIEGSEIREKAQFSDLLKKAPLIVLVNGGSASASEIVAGALQDHKRAIILGEKTFGKGSVQTVLPLQDHYGLKLTTALYYTPAGRSIQATGIEPDLVVKDLKIPVQSQEDKDKEKFTSIREADLEGHLENGDGSETTSDMLKKESTQQEVWFQHDYQLGEAFNLLKGLTILDKN